MIRPIDRQNSKHFSHWPFLTSKLSYSFLSNLCRRLIQNFLLNHLNLLWRVYSQWIFSIITKNEKELVFIWFNFNYLGENILICVILMHLFWHFLIQNENSPNIEFQNSIQNWVFWPHNGHRKVLGIYTESNTNHSTDFDSFHKYDWPSGETLTTNF